MRRYYLHKRKGTFYAQVIDQTTGLPLTGKSTGTRNRDEALLVIAGWLKDGVPAGRQRKPRSVMELAGVQAVLKACRTADLTVEDAAQICAALDSGALSTSPRSRAEKARRRSLPSCWNSGTQRKAPTSKTRLPTASV